MGERWDTAGLEVDMLPRLQRATLRATFEYLAGVDLPTAAAADGGGRGGPRGRDQRRRRPAGVWEDEYLAAATDLRALIPARARSVWMLSDWAYALSPVGRLERARIREARRLPELALRAAVPGSPLDHLRRGPRTVGGDWRGRGGVGFLAVLARACFGARVAGRVAGRGDDSPLRGARHAVGDAVVGAASARGRSRRRSGELRASLADDPAAMESLGLKSGVPAPACVADERGRAGSRGVPPRDPPAPPRGAVRGEEADEWRPRVRGGDGGDC